MFSKKIGNKLKFYRINSVSDPLFSKLYNLYTTAFPPVERRSSEGLEHEIIYEKQFNPNVLILDGESVGLFNYWIFERFYYLEHFAIVPNFRNKHIGSEAIDMFEKQVNLPIVFEVELPNSPIASRRIKFYERLGFSVLLHDYAQPPYGRSGFLLPVLIMSNNVHFANTHFGMIKDTLYNKVYHYKTSNH